MGTFVLAVDIGTSRMSAATARRTAAGDIDASTMALGRARDTAPSSVFIGDTAMLFGDAAERRGLAQPDRLLRAVVERIGDEVPYIAGERRVMPADVFAAAVAWAIDTAREREGNDPLDVVVTVPMTWGAYRTELVRSALDRIGLGATQVMTAPDAAAREYESVSPVRPGRALAVYDLGGGVFESVVLRKDRSSGRLQLAGTPASAEDLGGTEIDDAVLARVLRSAGLTTRSPEFDGAPALTAAALRRECIEAKEALSYDSETVVPVIVGSGGSVRLTRGELESMIEPMIERTMDVLDRAIESARIDPADLDAILLVGGSSRIPRVAQMISERFDRPVVVDLDPKAIVAIGAARAVGAIALAQSQPAGLDTTVGFAATTSPLPRRSWLRRALPGAAAGTAAVALAAGLVISTGSALAPATTSFALTADDGILSLAAIERAIANRARADDATPPVASGPDAAPPLADWSSPRTRTPDDAPSTPRTSAPNAHRDPIAAAPQPDTAAPAPRSPAPSPAPRSPAQSDAAPAANNGAGAPPADPVTSPSPPVDPNPLDPTPGDPTPAGPAPADPAPQPDPQPEPEPEPEPQPESSTPPADPVLPADGTAG
jgi:molecular chaperone DnaK